MNRRTKIVSTLGPASTDIKVIEGLIEAGVNVFRMNFSHGTHEEHRQRIIYAREAARKLGKDIAILQDLQGPKIRVGEIENGAMLLQRGNQLVLTTEEGSNPESDRVYVSYPTLPEDVEVGGRILLDDGLLELKVLDTTEKDVITEVVVGGPLRSRKGVNLPHLRASVPALTDKDLADLEFGISMEVDVIALSFVRDESDVTDLVQRIRNSGKQISVIAKIEKPEAVRKIDQILEQADGIMVARGDLGIEMPMEQVPGTQKQIILKCRQAAKPVITATQMLESMIEGPMPTRAEVSDVATAIYEGADAVMLSAESAAGQFPVEAVTTMDRVAIEVEADPTYAQIIAASRNVKGSSVADGIVAAAREIAETADIKAICCYTQSGTTALLTARERPSVPIIAMTSQLRTARRLALSWGCTCLMTPELERFKGAVVNAAQAARAVGYASENDQIVITAGVPFNVPGTTNILRIAPCDERLIYSTDPE